MQSFLKIDRTGRMSKFKVLDSEKTTGTHKNKKVSSLELFFLTKI